MLIVHATPTLQPTRNRTSRRDVACGVWTGISCLLIVAPESTPLGGQPEAEVTSIIWGDCGSQKTLRNTHVCSPPRIYQKCAINCSVAAISQLDGGDHTGTRRLQRVGKPKVHTHATIAKQIKSLHHYQPSMQPPFKLKPTSLTRTLINIWAFKQTTVATTALVFLDDNRSGRPKRVKGFSARRASTRQSVRACVRACVSAQHSLTHSWL